MKISELLNGVKFEIIRGAEDREITEVVYDNRKLKEGCLFVCIVGANFDGHSAIGDAVKAGAGAVVVRREVDIPEESDITVIRVEDTRYAMAYIAANYNGNPADKLKTIGVTGTKGKTTTTYMVKSILESAGLKTGLIGTIEAIIGEEHIHAVNTTPESYVVQEYFRPCVIKPEDSAPAYYLQKNNNPELYFLSENVNVHAKNQDDLNKMTELIGVQPVLIDSSIFSAQGRLRNYWTNIPLSPLPEESPLVVKDILEQNVPDKFYYEQDFDFYGVDKRQAADLHIKGFDLIRRVVSPYFKSYTLTACRGGNTQMKVYDEKKNKVRKLTPLEYRRLQTIPDWYKMDVANSHIYNMCGDGWTIEVIKHIFKGLLVT